MFDPTSQPGEQPQVPETTPAPVESGTAAPAGKAAEKPEEFDKRIAKLSEKYEKFGEDKLKEMRLRYSVAGAKADLITGRYKNAIRKVEGAKKEKFAEMMRQEKEKFSSISDEMKSKTTSNLLEEGEKEMVGIYDPYQKILTHVRGLNRLEEKDLTKLEALLNALNSMKANPKLEGIFLKALGKDLLDPKEMQYLVEQIKPVNLKQCLEQGKGEEIFEASQLGSIISVMQEGQKLELVAMLFASKPDDAGKILDVLTVTGQISNLQLKNLLDNRKIPDPPASQLRKQLEEGELAKRQEEYQKKVDTLGRVNEGRTPENPLAKTVGGPAIFGAMTLWGAATALVNFKLSMDWDNPDEGIARVLSNEYFLLGMGVAGVGVAGTTSIVAPETYDKYKQKFVGFFSGPEKKQEQVAAQKDELTGFIEAQMKRNPYLMGFLTERQGEDEFPGVIPKRTGLEIIKELVAEKQASKQTVSFSFEELSAKSGRRQKELLTGAYRLEGGKDINLQDSIRNIMAGLYHMKMDDPENLVAMVKDLNHKQGIA